MPRIFDNLTADGMLRGALRQTMTGAIRADFCIGYFNLRGWAGLADQVEKLTAEHGPVCRVLVGMQRPVEEEIRRDFGFTAEPETPDRTMILRWKREMAERFREQLTYGAPTNRDEAALQQLACQIRAGKVRIKLYLRHALHAKLYLVHRPDTVTPTVGYLGSSNLTSAGLSKQGELNVDVTDDDAAVKLQGWFDDRWNDSQCLDISDELVAIIEESWARQTLIPPYHVYLKMVYHLSQEARAGLSELTIPADIAGVLFEFQRAAVKIAAQHINKRRGVMIGDVVGLGKTLMATALARVLQEDQNTDTLIICPPNLRQMWEDYVERYHLHARVLPSSLAIRELPEKVRRYRVVLIDESHNFRNTEGRTYHVIRDYIQRNDSRVILLSATPYNKTYLDLSAQLRLFLAAEQNLGIRPEALLREMGETEFMSRHQCGPQTLLAFEKSEHADDWRNLMSRFLVRRTRGFIQENYAEQDETGRAFLPMPNGDPFYFPERVPKTVKFAFDEASGDAYPRLFAPTVVNAINELRLPRYGLGNYALKAPELVPSAAEKKDLEGLGRAGVRLKGFSRTNLFKRLESGGPAFLQSVERHILRNFVFLHGLDNDLPLPIGTQDVDAFDSRFVDSDAEQVELSGIGDDDTEDANQIRPTLDEAHYTQLAATVYAQFAGPGRSRFRWLRANLFRSSLRDDLLADARSLLGVLAHCGTWDSTTDAKLLALAKLIQDDHRDEKVLVFTQFADTVDYLTEQLRRLGVTELAGVTAEAANPTRLAWRFSPRSNGKEALARQEGELRVLIATDVLSEGQNLQDGAIIVNYDLPWAIIRLIQRAGRVDRIGQQSAEIRCYSFVPAEGLEQIIRLRGRIRARLRQNAEVVGTDETFFEDDDRQPLIDLYHEKAGILDEGSGGDELGVDPTSEAYQIWKNAIDADPTLQRTIEQLPDVIFATKGHEARAGAPHGALVFIRASDGNDALGWVNERREMVTESTLEVLRGAQCHPDTPALPRAADHHDLVEHGVQHMLAEQRRAGGQLGRTSGARYRVYERLKRYTDSLQGQTMPLTAPNLDEVKRATQEIFDHPLKGSATDSINRLLRSGAPDEEIAHRVIELRSRDELTVPSGETAMMEPRIICSMGLVGRG